MKKEEIHSFLTILTENNELLMNFTEQQVTVKITF
jgi:hypothetical protein